MLGVGLRANRRAEGPLGFDPITQAESGFMSMNGETDRVGLRAGPSIMDMSTAMMTCNAVLGALFARERLGRGQFIEIRVVRPP